MLPQSALLVATRAQRRWRRACAGRESSRLMYKARLAKNRSARSNSRCGDRLPTKGACLAALCEPLRDARAMEVVLARQCDHRIRPREGRQAHGALVALKFVTRYFRQSANRLGVRRGLGHGLVEPQEEIVVLRSDLAREEAANLSDCETARKALAGMRDADGVRPPPPAVTTIRATSPLARRAPANCAMHILGLVAAPGVRGLEVRPGRDAADAAVRREATRRALGPVVEPVASSDELGAGGKPHLCQRQTRP
eukprot:CAMPEP_0176073754 /NCGR_PEP_ID=MMETSP0120_2-20121206/36853_1 /TAXON_ID=160619 /ORGANISM="Kryptoperidinium foliaceum, Strain CCMP 1326" /LENGTH=253 /DNA_ID=CAMNT_0017407439 /DNA_START=73 /DNA_END=835 /DNA_ORIENTATION=-